MFKEMLVNQFKALEERYEIEAITENSVEVWDKEDKITFEFKFDENGNLKEIW